MTGFLTHIPTFKGVESEPLKKHTIHFLLVGGKPTPLNNMEVSWGLLFHILWKTVQMFQTTNQISFIFKLKIADFPDHHTKGRGPQMIGKFVHTYKISKGFMMDAVYMSIIYIYVYGCGYWWMGKTEPYEK